MCRQAAFAPWLRFASQIHRRPSGRPEGGFVRYWLSFLVITLTVSTTAASEAAKTFDLGGPRRVRAEVRADGDDYVVAVRMLSVHAFDATTNATLNGQKGRLFALQGLARYLSAGRDTVITVRHVTVAQAKADGQQFRLTLRVPRRDVRFEAGAEPPGTVDEHRIAFNSSLFRAKQDHENTLAGLVAAQDAKLLAIRKDPERFAEALQDWKDEGLRHLDLLAREVENDPLLLDVGQSDKPTEREELVAAIEQQICALAAQAAEATAEHKADERRKP
jgi:hypothetical protein